MVAQAILPILAAAASASGFFGEQSKRSAAAQKEEQARKSKAILALAARANSEGNIDALEAIKQPLTKEIGKEAYDALFSSTVANPSGVMARALGLQNPAIPSPVMSAGGEQGPSEAAISGQFNQALNRVSPLEASVVPGAGRAGQGPAVQDMLNRLQTSQGPTGTTSTLAAPKAAAREKPIPLGARQRLVKPTGETLVPALPETSKEKLTTVPPGTDVINSKGEVVFSNPASAKEPKFVSVPPEHSLVNTATGKPIFVGPPKKEKPKEPKVYKGRPGDEFRDASGKLLFKIPGEDKGKKVYKGRPGDEFRDAEGNLLFKIPEKPEKVSAKDQTQRVFAQGRQQGKSYLQILDDASATGQVLDESVVNREATRTFREVYTRENQRLTREGILPEEARKRSILAGVDASGTLPENFAGFLKKDPSAIEDTYNKMPASLRPFILIAADKDNIRKIDPKDFPKILKQAQADFQQARIDVAVKQATAVADVNLRRKAEPIFVMLAKLTKLTDTIFNANNVTELVKQGINTFVQGNLQNTPLGRAVREYQKLRDGAVFILKTAFAPGEGRLSNFDALRIERMFPDLGSYLRLPDASQVARASIQNAFDMVKASFSSTISEEEFNQKLNALEEQVNAIQGAPGAGAPRIRRYNPTSGRLE